MAVAVALSATQVAGQQPDPATPYGPPPRLSGEAPATAAAAAPDDSARLRRVAARAGDVVVTVGEIEHFLLHATPSEVQAYRTPAGRRGIVERLLRNHLLAHEAERRGSADPMLAFRAQRREERALRDLLEAAVRSSPGEIPPPSAPVSTPESRFAVILRTSSRQQAQEWADAVRLETFQTALTRGQTFGEVQQTPYGVAGEPPEATPPIEPALWRALFALEPLATSSPIALGRGRWASVSCAGVTGAAVNTGPDEGARRMLAGDRAWAQLQEQVRADLVEDYHPEGLDGVLFRLPGGVSPDQQRELAEEVAATRRRAALAEGAQ